MPWCERVKPWYPSVTFSELCLKQITGTIFGAPLEQRPDTDHGPFFRFLAAITLPLSITVTTAAVVPSSWSVVPHLILPSDIWSTDLASSTLNLFHRFISDERRWIKTEIKLKIVSIILFPFYFSFISHVRSRLIPRCIRLGLTQRRTTKIRSPQFAAAISQINVIIVVGRAALMTGTGRPSLRRCDYQVLTTCSARYARDKNRAVVIIAADNK